MRGMHDYGQFRTRRSRSVDSSVLSSFIHHQSPHPHPSTPAAPKAKDTATQFAVFDVEEEEEEEAAAGGGSVGDEKDLGVVLCRNSCASSEKVNGEWDAGAFLRPSPVTRAFSMRRLSSVSSSRGAAKRGSYSRIHDQIESEPSSPADGICKVKRRGKVLMFCKRLLGLK